MPVKNRAPEFDDDFRPAYDFSKLTGRVQGKHYAQAPAGVTMVLLESDVLLTRTSKMLDSELG